MDLQKLLRIGIAKGAGMQVLLQVALLHHVGAELKLSQASAKSDALPLRIAEEFLKKKSLPGNSRKKSPLCHQCPLLLQGMVSAARTLNVGSNLGEIFDANLTDVEVMTRW
jgi:hypothetical protein